jgi:hypothetical protein
VPASLIPGQEKAEEGEGDPAPTVPAEETGPTETLAQSPEKARELNLSRGQYRTEFLVPAKTDPKTKTGETKRIEMGGEYKRVHFYKVDVSPTGQTTDDGEKLARVTAVFRVIDNPLPLVPIAWGAAGLVGVGGGSWLLFSSAESFVEDTQWPILTGTAAIMSLLVAYHTLYG